jgi:hypothetical protein
LVKVSRAPQKMSFVPYSALQSFLVRLFNSYLYLPVHTYLSERASSNPFELEFQCSGVGLAIAVGLGLAVIDVGKVFWV